MATSKTAKIILIGGAIVFVLFLVAIIGIVMLAGALSRPSIAQNTVLVVDLSGTLPDYTPDDPMAEALGLSGGQSFVGTLTQLRKAKVDNRIGGVMLEINFPDIGWGRAEELRDAIKDLRTSGKPVYAYMEIGSNKEYYIASAADKVFLPPPGDLYVNGLAGQAMFIKGSLDKLGVEADVIQIGPKYKNAPDQYTKTEMGEGQKEVMNAILDEYFERMTAGISEERKLPQEDVKTLIDNAPYTAPAAKEAGLIDDALYREQVYDEFRKSFNLPEGSDINTIRASKYRDVSSDSLGLNTGEKVAVIFASGAITSGPSGDSVMGGSSAGSDTIVKAVNDAANDNTVKAIVLRVDSPGGSALASDLMWFAIENAKTKKPVVVSMGDVAASGGYYIACNANKIIAQRSTITGSIGVFMGKPVIKGMYDWLGISSQYMMRGKNSGIFRETDKWTPEERAKMEAQTNVIYFDNFIPKVATGRGISLERANELGQGRVWTGTQAIENGLIDEFGGLETAINTAKQLAGLPADKDVRRVVFPAPRPLLETLFDPEGSAGLTSEQKAQKALADSLPKEARRALRYTELFERMRRGETMAMMPFELEIK